MQVSHDKMIARIYGHGRGWVFSRVDFLDLGSDSAVRKSLSRLCADATIRRIAHGLYDYPDYSELLKEQLMPGVDDVARAVARKYGWRIQPSGAAALNYFGLSTQVPGRMIYFSDGPSRHYEILTYTIVFKSTALKESGFKFRESGLLVQAIKELGQEYVNSTVIEKMRRQIPPMLRPKIARETRLVTGWVYEAIKSVCGGEGS